MFACIVEVIRTRLRQEGNKYRSFLQTLILVAKEEGGAALYRGLATQLMRQIPNTAIMMSTYEAVVYFMSDTDGWELARIYCVVIASCSSSRVVAVFIEYHHNTRFAIIVVPSRVSRRSISLGVRGKLPGLWASVCGKTTTH